MSSGYFGQSDQMEHRHLGEEFGGIASNMPAILNAEKDFSKWQVSELYPEMAAQERVATTLQRRSDLSNLSKLGPGFQQTLEGLSPSWRNAMSGISAETMRGNQPDPLAIQTNIEALGAGPSAIRQELDRQALGDLGLGRSLSPQETREAMQASRQAFADRGLSDSNSAIVMEALNRDNAGTLREGQRRQFAGNALQLGLAEDAQNRNFQTSVEAQNEARLGQWRNFLGAGAQIGQNSLAPLLGFFGQRAAVNPTAPAAITQATSGAINPLIGYGSDLYNTNFNSDAATRINNANQMAAIHGAVIGAVGSIAGGAAKCWVAREVLGTETDDWTYFKSWLLRESPRWFHNLYSRHGEAFARWLRDKPRVKAFIRPFFLSKVERMKTLEEYSHAI